MDKEADQDKVVLGIHSYGGGGGFTDGHAWITVQRGNGPVQYYGLWPDEHPAVRDNGNGTDIRQGMEQNSKSDADRYYTLNPDQVRELDMALGENVTWGYNHNCSSWASETVSRVTGRQIDASTWLPTVETPNALKETIRELEAKQPTSPDKPADPNQRVQGSSSLSSNDVVAPDGPLAGQERNASITDGAHPGSPLFHGLRNALPEGVADERVALAAVRAYENGIKDMSQVARVSEVDGHIHVAGITPGFRASVFAHEAAPSLEASGQALSQQMATAQAQDLPAPTRVQALG